MLMGVFFSILASKLFLIHHYGSSVPFWDQWDAQALRLLIPYFGGTLSWQDLLSPHNEHRITLTRAFSLLLYGINGQWDPILEMVAQAVIHSIIITFLMAVSRSFLTTKLWVLLCLTSVSVYAFAFAWENTLWGFQSQFYFCAGSGVLGMWLCLRSIALSASWLLGWSILLVGFFSMGSAILAPLALLVTDCSRLALGLKPISLRSSLSVLLLLLLVIVGLVLRVDVPRHAALKAQSLQELITFLSELISWPVHYPILGLLLYAPVVIFGAYILCKRPPARSPLWTACALSVWVALNIIALAYGRANHGLASRYTDTLILGLLVSFANLLILRSSSEKKYVSALNAYVGVFIAFLMAGLFKQQPTNIAEVSRRKECETIQASNISHYILGHDPYSLRNKPNLHIPYHNSELLEHVLNDELLQESLPDSLNPGAEPDQIITVGDAFVANTGTYPTTPSPGGRKYFGSYNLQGDGALGEVRLNYNVPPVASWLELMISGYPHDSGQNILIESAGGVEVPLIVTRNPHEEWDQVIFANPRRPFAIIARDHSPTSWVAISLPSPVGTFSGLLELLLSHWWVVAGLGLGLVAFASCGTCRSNNDMP
jgi:hypothetical protein